MAKKKTEQKSKSFADVLGVKNIFNNEKADFVLGFFVLCLAVCTIIAMISYLYTGHIDQSILEDLRPGEWLNTKHDFVNYCGSIGAISSYYLITENFGLAAFIIPVFIILVGLRLMRVNRLNMFKWFLCLATLMIWCSVAFAKFLPPLLSDMFFNPGGNHGLFCVQQLENLIGPPGLTYWPSWINCRFINSGISVSYLYQY